MVDGFSVRLAPGDPREQRFSLAHEVAHSLLYDFSPGLKPAVRAGIVAGVALEAWCDRVARELLMPDSLVQESLSHTESVDVLAMRFGVPSDQFVIWRSERRSVGPSGFLGTRRARHPAG
jgi:Zn-dependent peptidase ImmA (M78 family)